MDTHCPRCRRYVQYVLTGDDRVTEVARHLRKLDVPDLWCPGSGDTLEHVEQLWALQVAARRGESLDIPVITCDGPRLKIMADWPSRAEAADDCGLMDPESDEDYDLFAWDLQLLNQVGAILGWPEAGYADVGGRIEIADDGTVTVAASIV